MEKKMILKINPRLIFEYIYFLSEDENGEFYSKHSNNTHVRLQKLTYLCCRKIYDEIINIDFNCQEPRDCFHAWRYGATIPSVYADFKFNRQEWLTKEKLAMTSAIFNGLFLIKNIIQGELKRRKDCWLVNLVCSCHDDRWRHFASTKTKIMSFPVKHD